MTWISVNERLPEPGVSVLVWVPESANHDGGYTIDMIDPESDGDLWLDHYEHGVPKEYAPYTHWQPLPPPPGAEPRFKPGDEVVHIDYPEYGIGKVVEIARSGKRALVNFPSVNHTWESGIEAYYTLAKLRPAPKEGGA